MKLHIQDIDPPYPKRLHPGTICLNRDFIKDEKLAKRHTPCKINMQNPTTLWDVIVKDPVFISIEIRAFVFMEEKIPKQLGPKEVCRLLNLSHRQLDYWVLIGVVHPILEPHGKKVFKKFTDEDFYFLKEVKSLTDDGFLVSKAAQKVRENWSKLLKKNGQEESTK